MYIEEHSHYNKNYYSIVVDKTELHIIDDLMSLATTLAVDTPFSEQIDKQIREMKNEVAKHLE